MFEFNVDKDALDKKSQVALDAFLGGGFGPQQEWTNDKGEVRKIVEVILPLGAITDMTTYDGPRKNFHTPSAKIPGKMAQVHFLRKTGDTYADTYSTCNQEEWLSWLGNEASFVSTKPVNKRPAQFEEQIKAQLRAQPYSGDSDVLGEKIGRKGAWVKPGQRQKTAGEK